MNNLLLDYRYSHTAPVCNDELNNSLDNLKEVFGDDMYSNKAYQYYGDGYNFDKLAISIIQSYYLRPNKQIRIYRAVPKILTLSDKIKELEKHKSYILAKGKLPKSVTNWSCKSEYYNFCCEKIELYLSQSEGKKQKITINSNDWITTTKEYAIHHGKNCLDGKYRILSKVVLAKNIFSDGNSIHEFGYSE